MYARKAGDGVHRFKPHAEAALEKFTKRREVKQLLHHCSVVSQRIDDDYFVSATRKVASSSRLMSAWFW